MLKVSPTHIEFSKKQFITFADSMEVRLIQLQRQLLELNIPVLIAVDGWSTSGKGHCIGQLVAPMDPRGYCVHSSSSQENNISPLQDFWCGSPQKGHISLFDRSWFRPAMQNKTYAKEPNHALLEDAKNYEKLLSDSGCLIIKIFLNISRKEQLRRIKRLQADPNNNWRINSNDLQQNLYFKEYRKAASQVIEASHSDHSPWHIIPADNRFYAQKQCIEIIEKSFSQAIFYAQGQQKNPHKISLPTPPKIPARSKIDLQSKISKNDYDTLLPKLQKKVRALSYKLHRNNRSVLILFEGWDAAGKGGAIRRLTRFIDPRDFIVHPVAAPSTLELSHYYLWRFWNRLPKKGSISIHDRSWYGRVLVERVENFCSTHEWQRAYQEIVSIEQHLVNHGVVILKFWLDIDPETQQERFDLRLKTPHKTWKITKEDWRNRKKWNDYEHAVNDMIHNTSHQQAQWKLIPANQKRFARIAVIKHAIEQFEIALEQEHIV
jgi:AMP-polyphosphate phosphotransferase